jgi:type I restriction enzyme S subunit
MLGPLFEPQKSASTNGSREQGLSKSRWRTSRLENVARITKGRKPSSVREGPEPGFVPYLTASYLRSAVVDLFASADEPSVIATEGEALVLWDGAGAGDVFQAQAGVVASTMALVRPFDTTLLDPSFLSLVLATHVDRLRSTRRGTTVPHIDPAVLAGVEIPVPPLTVQQRIVDLVTAVRRTEGAAARVEHRARALSPVLIADATSGFSEVPLKDVVRKAKAGATPSRRRAEYFGGPIKWLKSGEVDNPSIDETEETITLEALEQTSTWLAPSGSVVVAMYGATAGMVGRLSCEMAMNQAVLALIADETKADQGFLYHWLKSRTMSLKSRSAGGAQSNLSKELVLAEPVRLPDLATQLAIASALDGLTVYLKACREYRDRLAKARAAMVGHLLVGDHEIPDSYDAIREGV